MSTPRAVAKAASACLFAAHLLTACGLAGDRSDPAPDRRPGATSTGAEVRELHWRDCDDGLQCATMAAPLDYRKPRGALVELAVVRARARQGARRIGPLFVNPGGPGAPATGFVRAALEVLPGDVRDRFDVVGVDPRGIGGSSAFDCERNVPAMYRADPTVETSRDRAVLLSTSRAFTSDCEAAGGALLAHMGTRDAARDLDLVRAALGYGQLSYLGYSYGTALGQVYADLFPDRVRAMVLDGIVDVGLAGVAGAALQADGFEHALREFAADCRADDGCPLAPDPIAVVDRVTAAVERRPLQAPAADRPAGPGELALAMTKALYSESRWADLQAALAAADGNGDGSRLVALADDYVDTLPFGGYFAVSCLDAAWPDPAGLFAAATRAGRSAPHFGEAVTTDYLRCSLWPTPPQPLTRPDPDGLAPLLLVSTTGDPATPHRSAVDLARRLGGSVLVTVQGDHHGTVFQGASTAASACVDRAAEAYLVALTVPPGPVSCP